MRQCRQKQNELWTLIEQRGQATILNATSSAQNISQGDLASQQQALSDLVIDIKRLQSLSSSRLQIEPPAVDQAVEEQKLEEEKHSLSEIFVALDSDSE